jgi:hypothetical protein
MFSVRLVGKNSPRSNEVQRPSYFSSIPSGYWDDKQNHRRFFDDLAANLNISVDQLATVPARNIVAEGGFFLNSHYDGSVQQGIEISLNIHHLFCIESPIESPLTIATPLSDLARDTSEITQWSGYSKGNSIGDSID